MDFHTGRASCFILYDTENETFDVVDNWKSIDTSHWAGLKLTNKVIEAGAEVVVVRNIGPNAFRDFTNSKIEIFYTEETTVVKAIRRFREGELSPASEPNCTGHHHLHSKKHP